MRQHILLGLIFLFTSCSYSTSLIATYTVQHSAENTKYIATGFIQKLADSNQLSKDKKYSQTDTIGYFGKPYHYFKFWFEQKDSLTLIKLDYWGISIGTKKSAYDDFLKNLKDSIEANFETVVSDIKVTKNK